MNRVRLGRQLRALRIRRRLRQSDLARAAAVSRPVVSRAETGVRVQLSALERLAHALGAELELGLRWHGGELDRLVNAAHTTLAEQVIAWIAAQPGWEATAEVSFAIGAERGVVDILAWHPSSRTVVQIELKTGIYDVGELLGTFGRKIRLAREIAAQQGLAPAGVSAWLIVADGSTNRRRLAAHRASVASLLPADGRALRRSFAHPAQPVRGVAFWSPVQLVDARAVRSGGQRVRRRQDLARAAASRSGSLVGEAGAPATIPALARQAP